ncbi:hypothetical protein [Paramagnetospirillum marisnigri]|nr:hypothetical protein [Paramagnetospirillum marisnigri]
MARGRKKASSNEPGLSPAEKLDAINSAYEQLYGVEDKIAALLAEHVEPLKKQRTAIWRGLKKGTDTARTDLDLGYRIYKRDRLAAEMDDTDGERIRAGLKLVFNALTVGEQLDWINATAAVETDQADAFEKAAQDEGDSEHDDEGVDGPSEITASTSDGDAVSDQEPEPTAPDADWAAAAAADDESFDNSGHAYHEAIEAGKLAAGDGLDENPYPDGSPLAKAWAQGHASDDTSLNGYGDDQDHEDVAVEAMAETNVITLAAAQ